MRRQEEGTINWEEEGEGWIRGGRWSDDGGAMSGRGGGSCGKMGREVGGPRVRFQPHAQKPSTNMPMGLATNIANTSLHCFAQTRHSICFSGLLVCVGGLPPWVQHTAAQASLHRCLAYVFGLAPQWIPRYMNQEGAFNMTVQHLGGHTDRLEKIFCLQRKF